MASTMLQKFWDSALALEPPDDDDDSRRYISFCAFLCTSCRYRLIYYLPRDILLRANMFSLTVTSLLDLPLKHLDLKLVGWGTRLSEQDIHLISSLKMHTAEYTGFHAVWSFST